MERPWLFYGKEWMQGGEGDVGEVNEPSSVVLAAVNFLSSLAPHPTFHYYGFVGGKLNTFLLLKIKNPNKETTYPPNR